jgi:hypothetical protein
VGIGPSEPELRRRLPQNAAHRHCPVLLQYCPFQRTCPRRRGGEGMMGRLLSGSGGEWSSSATMGARESSTNPHLSAEHRQGVRPSLLVAPTCRAAEAGGSGQDRLLVSMPMRVGVNDEKATENGQQASWSSDGERKGDAQVPQARPAHPHHGRRRPSPLSLLRAAISPQ